MADTGRGMTRAHLSKADVSSFTYLISSQIPEEQELLARGFIYLFKGSQGRGEMNGREGF